MRQITAILLTLVLLLNVLGFYGILEGLNHRNKQQIKQRLDDDRYDKGQTLTLRIPITIPYGTNSVDYERVNGDFEYQGEYYHLVKQRLLNDTLYIVCIKDAQSKKIHQALADYVKSLTDKATDAQPSGKIVNNFLKDFLFTAFAIEHHSTGWVFVAVQNPVRSFFIDSFFAAIVHPPERV